MKKCGRGEGVWSRGGCFLNKVWIEPRQMARCTKRTCVHAHAGQTAKIQEHKFYLTRQFSDKAALHPPVPFFFLLTDFFFKDDFSVPFFFHVVNSYQLFSTTSFTRQMPCVLYTYEHMYIQLRIIIVQLNKNKIFFFFFFKSVLVRHVTSWNRNWTCRLSQISSVKMPTSLKKKNT